MTEDQYAELAQLWHEYMVLGPRREDRGLDRTGRALMFCQWMDSDPDEDPAYGLPDILAFFDEKARREGTALPLETMSDIEKIAADRYRIRAHNQIITLSAQDLRDVYDWALLHMRELEQEAKDAAKVRAYNKEQS